jgi:hypothetical protein
VESVCRRRSAINWFDSDRGSDTEAGFNILVLLPRGLFFEIKIGAMDSLE